MRLQDKEHKHPAFDVARGLGEALIAAGTVEEYKQDPFSYVDAAGVKRERLHQNISWIARKGFRSSDGDRYSPEIYYKCSSCGNAGIISGPTAQKTQKVHCCGLVTSVPKEIQEQYAQLRKRLRPDTGRNKEC